MAPPTTPLPVCVPPPGVSQPRPLVRRLGRRVGCSSGSPRRFRPLGLGTGVSIHSARELLAIQQGLLHFQLSLRGYTVAVYCNNVTAVAYLRKEGGTRSPLLNTIAQEILRWSESLAIRLAPQFIPGSNNVLADALSRPHQLPHSEWSLNMIVFQSLCRLWLVQIDLFATSANHRCSIYFLLTETLSRRAQTPSSSPGMVYRLTPFLRLPSFPESSRNSGNLGGRSSPLWLHIGLSALGFRISSSCRWPLRSSFQIV